MTWERLPPVYRDVATEVCTRAELDALALHLANYSERQIARTLAISRRSVRDRIDNANRKIHDHPAMPRETECA